MKYDQIKNNNTNKSDKGKNSIEDYQEQDHSIRNQYYYDFGDAEPTDELPQNIEAFSERVKAQKNKILQQRQNDNKIQQLRQMKFNGNDKR